MRKKEKLEAFVRSWKQKVPIEYISVDSAEANLIVDLRNEYIRKGLPTIIASYKATIKQRIDTEVILLSAIDCYSTKQKQARKHMKLSKLLNGMTKN